MPDKETVINRLQIIHTWAEFARERDLQFFTTKHLEDIAQWADDAIVMLKEQDGLMLALEQSNAANEYLNAEVERLTGLLKEQEACVMTLDEIKAFDWDYCYLEEERLPGKEYRNVCGDYALTCITWPCINSMRIQHGDDSYGKKWRCWSAKPTDEQRQAVKWND